jgi:exodeoxyribonuclease X
MMIRCIDFETTGIPTPEDKHAIVEIGWADVIDGMVGAPSSVLCKPDRAIPAMAMAVHHITDEMVASASGALDVLGAPDYFAAHNADFERQFFQTETPVICTYKAALRIWPDAESHSLQFLRYHLGLLVDPALAAMPHRAGPDAYICAALLGRILTDNRASIDDMVRWSNGPALLPRCPMGKHRGKKWEEVPTDYLQWVAAQPDMDVNIKANAKHHLKKRSAA